MRPLQSQYAHAKPSPYRYVKRKKSGQRAFQRYKDRIKPAFVLSVLLHLAAFAVLVFVPLPQTPPAPQITVALWEQPAAIIEEETPQSQPVLPESKAVPAPQEPARPAVKQQAPAPKPAAAAQPKPLRPAVKPTPAPKPAVQAAPAAPPRQEAPPRAPALPASPALEKAKPAFSKIEDEPAAGAAPPDDEAEAGSAPSEDDGDWDFLEAQPSEQLIGNTLLRMQTNGRFFAVAPDFSFLNDASFTARAKSVKLEITISPDGSVLKAVTLGPGAGNPELDRKLRMAVSRSFFNDVSFYGQGVQTGVLTLNFKE